MMRNNQWTNLNQKLQKFRVPIDSLTSNPGTKFLFAFPNIVIKGVDSSKVKITGNGLSFQHKYHLLFIIRSNSMGNESSLSDGEAFEKRNWELVDTQEEQTTWRNRSDPTQSIIERTIYSASDAEESEERQMFVMRKNHPTLVAARYLITQSSGQFCSSSHLQKLFIEKIPIRLSDVEQVPFPDFLHIYHQSLRGFQELSRHVGFFPIEQEYIGINENAVVKVWMNQNYFKNYYTGAKISQEFMVKSLIEIIQRNIDHHQIPQELPSVRNYLYRNTDKLTFELAIQQFNGFLKQYVNGYIPSRLQCIDRVGGIDAIAHHEKQEKIARNQNPTVVQSPYHSTLERDVDRSNSRPHLFDSQFLRERFPVATPRIQTQQIYYEVPADRLRVTNGSQAIVPNVQKNILSPSTVREHTPIVRKTVNSLQSPQQAIRVEQKIQIPRQISAFPAQPTSKEIHYRITDRPESKSFGSKVNPIIFRPQQAPSLPIAINQQQKNVQGNNFIAGKTSLIQLVQPQTPKYNEEVIKGYNFTSANSAFLKDSSFLSFQNANLKIQPTTTPPAPLNIPSSFLYERPSSKSLTQRTQKRLNSFVIPSESLQVNVNNYENIQNEIISSPRKQQLKNQYQQNSAKQSSLTPIQELNQRKSQHSFSKITNEENIYYPKNTIKTSQYTTVDIDDGKSSSDFLKKLKEFNNFGSDLNFQSKSTLLTQKTSDLREQKYNFPSSIQNHAETPVMKETNSVQNINHNEEARSQEQFGRNAVSNIILNQSEVHVPSQKNYTQTPFKFEKNLDLKYSMFKADEPPSPTYESNRVYKPYDPNFDADILADINKLKSSN